MTWRSAISRASRVAQIELRLAGTPFALGGLDRDAGALHAVADRADQALLLGRLQDVIVLDVPAGGLETFVALLAGALVRLVEHVELELGRHVGAVAHRLGALDLATQDRARRVRQQLAVVVDHVAEHQRGAAPATGSGARSRGPAGSRSRRSRDPRTPRRSPGPAPSPCRRRADSRRRASRAPPARRRSVRSRACRSAGPACRESTPARCRSSRRRRRAAACRGRDCRP